MHRIAYHREHATMRVIILIAGSILLLLGVISMVTPIPGGTLAIAVGGGMIICTSETAKRYIRICRCLLYTSPSPRDRQKSRMPSSA